MFYTPFFDLTWPFFEVWRLIFHTDSTANTDKKRLVRRVGMGETNVNNTHNFIHKSSYFMFLR